MAPEAPTAEALKFVMQVECTYELLLTAEFADAANGLGGSLVYVGELDTDGRALIVAANIAAAASLAATADRAIQKRALHDGIVDFLVNSLDEALRILKNQLRKHEPVAVCVCLEPPAVEIEMRERGVRPDLLRSDISPGQHVGIGAQEKEKRMKWLTWTIETTPAQSMQRVDTIAIESLPDDAWQTRRWLRLAPRYLGRLAEKFRVVHCDETDAVRIAERISTVSKSGEFGVGVNLVVTMQNRHPSDPSSLN